MYHYIWVCTLQPKPGRTDVVPSTFISAVQSESEIDDQSSLQRLTDMGNRKISPRKIALVLLVSAPTKEKAEEYALYLQSLVAPKTYIRATDYLIRLLKAVKSHAVSKGDVGWLPRSGAWKNN